MEKLTDFIKPDMNFQDLSYEATPEKVGDMLFKLKFIKNISDRMMATPPDKLKDFNAIEDYYEIAKAIDIVFHKDNIVQRAIIFVLAIQSIEETCDDLISKLNIINEIPQLIKDARARRDN